VPFSIGPRICAGMAFGMTEAILCVAMLAQRFRLALAPGHVMEPLCRVSLRPGPGDDLPMLLHRRNANANAAPAEAAAVCPFGHG
jgi:cytochrome P450